MNFTIFNLNLIKKFKKMILSLEENFNYPVFVILYLSIIGMMGFGAIIKYHYDGGKKFLLLRKSVILFSEVPMNINNMLKYKTIDLNRLNNKKDLLKHIDKKRFEQFLENKRNALLVLPRHDYSMGRAVIDIVDLNNFKIIHTYKHDIKEMRNEAFKTSEFSLSKMNNYSERFRYRHPLLFEDGSIITHSDSSIALKIDFCSNLEWINNNKLFHHSQMLDHEGNIWVGNHMTPKSKYVNKYSIKNYLDDSIIKMNTKGKVLFNKSVTEILIENNIFPNNFALAAAMNTTPEKEIDPIHLNDIEPAFTDTKYWKKGDVFLSLRHQSAIIHYRPSTNKVINYITGPFANQHDIDIISDKEISIFNNNNFYVNNDYSEVVIYNFETKKFKTLFNDQLQKNNFKTFTEGLSHIFKDGALMVEEQNHGRIILFNNKGEKEWEFINKDKNGDIGDISWSRIIEDELFIKKFKSLVKNKTCLN